MKETKVVKGYKGFNPDFTCKGKQYKENTIFEEPEAAICEIGMHYCKNPLDVLDYYDLFDEKGNMNKFAEVEPLEKEKTNDGVKFCTRKLKIHSKLSLAEFIRASLNVTFSSIKKEVENATKNIKETNDNEMAGGDSAQMVGGAVVQMAGGAVAQMAGGNSAQMAGGDYTQMVGGNSAKMAGGDCAKMAGGNCAQMAGGNSAKMAGGDSAQMVGGAVVQMAGGDCAKMAGGNSAKMAGGDYAKMAGGKNSVIVCGHGSMAKAGKNSVIVLTESGISGNIVRFKAEQVDGVRIKEDTFYFLKDGEFKEYEG